MNEWNKQIEQWKGEYGEMTEQVIKEQVTAYPSSSVSRQLVMSKKRLASSASDIRWEKAKV